MNVILMVFGLACAVISATSLSQCAVHSSPEMVLALALAAEPSTLALAMTDTWTALTRALPSALVSFALFQLHLPQPCQAFPLRPWLPRHLWSCHQGLQGLRVRQDLKAKMARMVLLVLLVAVAAMVPVVVMVPATFLAQPHLFLRQFFLYLLSLSWLLCYKFYPKNGFLFAWQLLSSPFSRHLCLKLISFLAVKLKFTCGG